MEEPLENDNSLLVDDSPISDSLIIDGHDTPDSLIMVSNLSLSFVSGNYSRQRSETTSPSPFSFNPIQYSTPLSTTMEQSSSLDTPASLIISSSSFRIPQSRSSASTSPLTRGSWFGDCSFPHEAKRRKLFHSSQAVESTSLDTPQLTLTPESSVSSDVSVLLASFCCKKRCLAHFTFAEAEAAKQRFRSKTTTQQNQFLLDCFLITTSIEDTSPGCQCIEGKQVCSDAFIRLLGISLKRYKHLFARFSEGVTVIQQKPAFRSETIKVTQAKAWMSQYFNRVGDHMPHVKQIHLPHCLTKKDFYQKMRNELEGQGIPESEIISPSHFYRIWKKFFSHVVIPEVSNCTDCTFSFCYCLSGVLLHTAA